MCRVLQVSPSGYYAWRGRGQSKRDKENESLLAQIKAIHAESRQTYGSPRIFEALKDRGAVCSLHRVERLMRKNDIRAKRKRRFRHTTDSKHDLPVASNVLDREFDVRAPNRVWAADVSYVWSRESWLYLAVVLDLFSRRVVGWSMQTHNDRTLVMARYLQKLWMTD